MYLTEEQTAFVDSIKKMVERHVAPIAAEIDATDAFPKNWCRSSATWACCSNGFPNNMVDPAATLTLLCLAKHEIAKVSMACSILAGQNSIGMILPLLHFGTEAQRQRFSSHGRQGTNPDRGLHVRTALRLRRRRHEDQGGARRRLLRHHGEKCFITFGSVAHWVLLFARTSEGRGVNGISAFLVDTKTPGFKVGRNEKKMGLGGVPNVQLFFENMRVPAENRLGEEGQGFKACMHILDLNRPTVAAESIGIGQGALDAAIAYAKERNAFGKPIASFQGLQWMIADMAMQLEAARCLLFECTRQVDMGDFSQLSMMASMAKCFGSDVAMKVTTDAVQIFGGVGYFKDYPVERMMRDAKINQIWEGTNQIQRVVISRHLLGRDA